jgi:hypothetical protein
LYHQFAETSGIRIKFACTRPGISCEVVESDFHIFGLVLNLDSFISERKKFPDGVAVLPALLRTVLPRVYGHIYFRSTVYFIEESHP